MTNEKDYFVRDVTDELKPYRTYPELITTIPQTIDHMLKHLSAGDSAFYNQVLDILAEMVQTRQKIRVGTIFQGMDYCGVQLLCDKILMPLFGREFVSKPWKMTTEIFHRNIEQHYVIFNEDSPYDLRSNSQRAKRIREAITKDRLTRLGKTVDSNATWFFYYEYPDELKLDAHDQIFNVSPYQWTAIDGTNWWTSESEIVDAIQKELPDFAAYLWNRPVNQVQIQISVKNRARDEAIKRGLIWTPNFNGLVIGNSKP